MRAVTGWIMVSVAAGMVILAPLFADPVLVWAVLGGMLIGIWIRLSRVNRIRRYLQIQCQHITAQGIYGDYINETGKRGFCPECGAWLDSLPMPVWTPEVDD